MITVMTDRYELVDIEKLCETLAQDAWEEITHKKSEEELYEYIVTKEGIDRQVRAEWAHEFFSILRVYKLLVNQFRKYPKSEIDI